MKKIIKIMLVISCILSLFGCSNKSKLKGSWVDNSGAVTLEFKSKEVIITMDILGIVSSTSYLYDVDDDKITLRTAEGVGLVINYKLKKDVLSLSNTFLFDGDYTKAGKNGTTDSKKNIWSLLFDISPITNLFKKDKPTNNDVNQNDIDQPTQQGQDTPAASVSYLNKSELDVIAAKTLKEFVNNYANEHSNEFVVAYLPDCLDESQVSEHQFDYYYVYFLGSNWDAYADVKVAKISVIALPNNEYTVGKDTGLSYKINLENVNDREMNVRSAPSTSGDKVGMVDTGVSFRIYKMDYSGYLTGEQYIWYCISSDGYSKWVADGIRAAKDYYIFDNGISTKNLVFLIH